MMDYTEKINNIVFKGYEKIEKLAVDHAIGILKEIACEAARLGMLTKVGSTPYAQILFEIKEELESAAEDFNDSDLLAEQIGLIADRAATTTDRYFLKETEVHLSGMYSRIKGILELFNDPQTAKEGE